MLLTTRCLIISIHENVLIVCLLTLFCNIIHHKCYVMDLIVVMKNCYYINKYDIYNKIWELPFLNNTYHHTCEFLIPYKFLN